MDGHLHPAMAESRPAWLMEVGLEEGGERKKSARAENDYSCSPQLTTPQWRHVLTFPGENGSAREGTVN